jgi:hypothetical protein
MNVLQSKGIAVVIGLVLAALAAWLVFGVFGLQTLFIDETVSEAGPVFDSGAASDSTTGEGTESSEFDEAMEDAEANPVEVDEDMMPGEIVTLAQGVFTGRTNHDVVGTAMVLNDGTEQRFLRLEDFESTNGPDLNVYLRAADDSFVDLGDLKGNIGNQNYEIPADVDLEVYDTVQIWCVRFSVLFGDAVLA